jgi:hypothetical protein
VERVMREEVYVILKTIRAEGETYTELSVYDTFSKALNEKERLIAKERAIIDNLETYVEEDDDLTYYAYIDNQDYSITIEIYQREVE